MDYAASRFAGQKIKVFELKKKACWVQQTQKRASTREGAKTGEVRVFGGYRWKKGELIPVKGREREKSEDLAGTGGRKVRWYP